MHLGHHFIHYFLNRELSEIYFTVALRRFATALISIFVPIYLLQQGFALQQVFLFYAIATGAFAALSYFSAKLSTKIGIKHCILIAMPFLIAFFLLLRFVTPDGISGIFLLTALCLGANSSLFWTNFHIDFARFSSRKKRAEQISGYAVICAILSAIGPVVGGFFLLYASFNALFLIVSVILVSATIPLFMSKEIYTPKGFSAQSVKSLFKKVGGRSIVGFAGYGMALCAMIAWPIFLFLILKTYLSVGALTSLSFLLSVAVTAAVGRWADRSGKGKVLRVGSILTSIGWAIRFFVRTGLQALGANIFFGIVAPAGPDGPAFDALNYDIAKRKHIAEVITIREIITHGTRAAFFVLLFFISSLHLALILGALGSLGVLAFSFQKKRV